MSTYTTTIWEVLKDLNKHEPDNILDIIEKHRKEIFDFEYSVPTKLNKDEFKKWFETSFLTRYLVYEIGSETFELFHVRLLSTCLRVMPIFARQIDNIMTIIPKDFYHGQYGTVVKHSDSKGTNDGQSKNMASTLPINMISSNAISDVDYADNSSKNENSSKNTNTYDDKSTYDLTYFVDITGILHYNNEIKKVYEDLFNQFDYLFLGVM